MDNITSCSIDNETIRKLGLRISRKRINAEIALDSRVFEYPNLENVYVMESDLYGNRMPKNSCFLVFNGKHGLIGKHLTLETLINASVADIRAMVEENAEG